MVPSVDRSCKGQDRKEEQELQIEPVDLSIELGKVPENSLVHHPKAANDEEAQDVAEQRRGLRFDRGDDLSIRLGIAQLSDVETKDEERQDDGKYTVAQRTNSRRV